jgi:hypothetical protein
VQSTSILNNPPDTFDHLVVKTDLWMVLDFHIQLGTLVQIVSKLGIFGAELVSTNITAAAAANGVLE